MTSPRSFAFVLATVAGALAPEPAAACGGLFCNSALPVVQNRERVVFVDHGDGTMSMLVEITYTGDAQRFSWVLPVAGTPALEVGATAPLSALDLATAPQFVQNFEGSFCPAPPWDGWGSQDASISYDSGTPAVTVVDSGQVGPYDYVIVSVDPLLTDPAAAGREWLVANGYDVTTEAAALLRDYLAGGQNLLAIKLQKNLSTGAIRPLIMRYASSVPVIPIRPTAVAAQPNMQVDVFLLGNRRAVPTSYDEVRILDAQLDGNYPYGSYATAVSRAIDEADGHVFVSEFAGARPNLLPYLGASPQRSELTRLAGITADIDMVVQAAVSFGRAEGFAAVAATNGVGLVPFVGCPACVELLANFDRAGFLADLDTMVVTPVERTLALFDQPYATRLHGELDPAQMNVDPVFAYVSGLPDVSNVHSYTTHFSCVSNANVTDWTRVTNGPYIPAARDESTLPAIGVRTDYDPAGVVTNVVDNTATILATTTSMPPVTQVDAGSGTGLKGGGGCAVGSVGRSSAGPLAWLFAWAAWASRRRARRERVASE